MDYNAAQDGVQRHSIMGNMKELSGYGRENEKFKPCLIVKGDVENRDMAINSSYMIDFFSSLPRQFDYKSASFLLVHFGGFCLFFLKIIHN